MRDWANDFDHFDPTYAADPFSLWDGRRGPRTLPIRAVRA